MNTATQHAWSAYQQAIFSFVETGAGNAIIEAVAGSGKTTTIVEALNRVRGRSIFLAFNKAIAEELKARGVNARTFHSLTYGVTMRHTGANTINANKLRDLVDDHLHEDDVRMYGAFITRLVSIGRQQGIGALAEAPDTTQAWADIVSHHDLELESEKAYYPRALELASQLLHWSNESHEVDFDDLLYLPVLHGLTLPKFDFVFVDEAQDTNAIQRAILRKICFQGTRLVAVGDPAQAIYGFRGADSDSLNLIAQEFNATRLPLTVSYRCPLSVVQYAQQWVKHIEAAPGAAQGIVEERDTKWQPTEFKAADLVVCRTTKPLVAMAYQFIKAQMPVRIMGREIGQGLQALINKMKAHGIDGLIERLNTYTARELQKAIANKQEAKAEAIQDKTDCVMYLIDVLPEDNRTILELLCRIEELFADVANATVLATIHKAKGLEATRVFWLNSSQCPAKWARQEWQQEQERNLCYVATTRARETLVLIEEQAS
jgi:DNA helicase II / ATP-dependent DNA helicase PcrA